jgi:hypothetical protein
MHPSDDECDRSDLIAHDIYKVIELAEPSPSEKAPDLGDEEAMEEGDVPGERGCWPDERLEREGTG